MTLKQFTETVPVAHTTNVLVMGSVVFNGVPLYDRFVSTSFRSLKDLVSQMIQDFNVNGVKVSNDNLEIYLE